MKILDTYNLCPELCLDLILFIKMTTTYYRSELAEAPAPKRHAPNAVAPTRERPRPYLGVTGGRTTASLATDHYILI